MDQPQLNAWAARACSDMLARIAQLVAWEYLRLATEAKAELPKRSS